MDNETFNKAVDIKNEISMLKDGFGFAEVNYAALSNDFDNIRISGKTSMAFGKDDVELFEFCRNYLLKKQSFKDARILELEKQFAEL
jgi:hypothetical protein